MAIARGEQALASKAITEETAGAAADAAMKDARPLSQNAYKVDVAKRGGQALYPCGDQATCMPAARRMYINPVVDPDEAALYDAYDNSAYWCVATQTGFGPDGDPVRADLCCGERGCCKL